MMPPLPLCVALALLATLASGCSDQQTARPLVATREGLVRGMPASSAGGRLFFAFRGVRYSQPPLGRLRFQPPRRHTAWPGVADASQHGSRCLQVDVLDDGKVVGTEDCLFANVYTPQLPVSQRVVGGLPVMVAVHGGGFTSGSGDDDIYGPSYIMDEDVVLVTFNYRLGPFGFFTTHDNNAPGNYGLLDQVLLLQWVRDNIASFGGDPQSVTIFGVSAGGASVSLLVLSPLTKGLFHHAITQSGSAIAGFAASGRRKASAQNLFSRLSCTSGDISEMVDCARDVAAQDLLQANAAEKGNFQPRVDRESSLPLLPEDPRVLLERGDFNLVPWMNGVTEEEGAFFLQFRSADKAFMSSVISGNLSAWGELADLTNNTDSSPLDCGAELAEEAAKVYAFYTGNDSVDQNSLLPIIRVLSDRIIVVPMSVETSLASRHTAVYRYVLDHTGPGRLGYGDLFGWPLSDTAPSHADDIPYLFSNNKLPLAAPGSPTYTMIRFMVSLWTSFARTGRPTTDVLAMPDWPVFTEHHQRHMRLNSEPSVGERLFEERADFWQTVRINEPWRHAVQTSCEQAPDTDHQRDPELSGTLTQH